MNVAEAVGLTLTRLGVRTVFGVVGSGNFHVTNALVAGGARFVAARHEGGAATMADAYARTAGGVGVLSVHQGPGLTNAMTGLAEAAKSRTPLLVLAGEATEPGSNFHIGQDAMVGAVGVVPLRVRSAESAALDTVLAYRTALRERRTVLLNLPLDVQGQPFTGETPGEETLREAVTPAVPEPPGAEAVARLAETLAGARRPVFVAGRGARHARAELTALADRAGALLATSAVAKGLFHDSPWNLDVSGGFASPLTAELIRDADVIVAWGCALNMWTTRHGTLIGPDARLVQVDLEQDAIGRHRPVHLGVHGEAAQTARLVLARLPERAPGEEHGYRTRALAGRIAAESRWRDVPYTDSPDGRIDPRTLSIELDQLLPTDRVIAVDSGNFMGYPSMFFSVPDEQGFCFTQAFQSIGLGLATAIGAALARPDRLPVAALGDGGALMGVAELETVVRLGLPMVIVIYDDEAYGAEVHHFGPGGHPLDTVTFPPADLAAIGRGFGCAGVTVREPADLAAVAEWLKGPRDRPLLIDAKVTADRGAWWLEEAFRGH
ncbi:acetolactate synthase I/II/III large subunit [Microtetraspora sp. NBRC 13810]|uniref:thiamine pyrophosphate-binding protein n=1 Tax=Microtetraspora sp. NBRC 13810 TaxID=3030990 RepID=UPI0024A58CF3|nr:thiamine pyrophosphate-binding protein [Microtetraspora sp. NBRC 13810]GLW13196.1 acetolactate synthase I/II/III large subunit [Microtetraspora sp. NBRC 13810]